MIIGISGGSGSGKTTVVNQILTHFSSDQVTLLSQDSYYHQHDHLKLEDRKKLNFDHPDSIEWDLMVAHLKELKQGNPIYQPVYSFVESNRTSETILTQPAPIILVEGILLYSQDALCDLFDVKYWIDVPHDIRFWRIVKRDTAERGKTLELTLTRYKDTVRPMHSLYIDPCKDKCKDFIYNDSFTELPNVDHVVQQMKDYLLLHK